MTAGSAFAIGKSSVGCKVCAQPLEMAIASQTVAHHAFPTGTTSSTNNNNGMITRRPTSSSYKRMAH